ncbi:hypothetical protein Syun_012226 [Stephania yunnanensis]|uniref:Uncharacterized protein n=1 Tax=Stephania yunnanensis TaxID=152371 RepID=A0AAP0PJA2_9MAGN
MVICPQYKKKSNSNIEATVHSLLHLNPCFDSLSFVSLVYISPSLVSLVQNLPLASLFLSLQLFGVVEVG